jgi:phosphoribosylglycinamide formyltransferase 1
MLNQRPPLRVAVLCSHRAPGLAKLLTHSQRGTRYEIVCVVSSEREVAQHLAIEDAGVPVIIHPIRDFLSARGAGLKNKQAREEYDTSLAEILLRLEVDVVVLLGYLYVLSDAMLDPFVSRVLNVHDSDLTILGDDGLPCYVGLRSTRDAIVAGEPETRTTLHFVDRRLDGGPVFLLSRPYPVAPFVREALAVGATDVVKAYAWAQREWMMLDCWADLVVEALDQIAGPVVDGPVHWLYGEPCRAMVAER